MVSWEFSFWFFMIYVYICTCIRIHLKEAIPVHAVASHGLKWENKTYKLFKSSRTNSANSAIEMDLNLVSETHCNPKQLNHLFLL